MRKAIPITLAAAVTAVAAWWFFNWIVALIVFVVMWEIFNSRRYDD